MPFAGMGVLSDRVSTEPRRGWGAWEKSRSLTQISPVTPETRAVGTFSKHGSLLSSVIFISSNVLLFDTIVILC